MERRPRRAKRALVKARCRASTALSRQGKRLEGMVRGKETKAAVFANDHERVSSRDLFLQNALAFRVHQNNKSEAIYRVSSPFS
jgi:hypothetical protein